MTNQKDYSTNILVRATAEQAFEALSIGIKSWWGSTEPPAVHQGTVFTVSWGEPWYRFKITAFEEPQRISWTCTDANQIIAGLEGVQKEWVGTQLHWTIEEMPAGMIKVSLLHQGLVPEFICFDFCSTTWDSFVQDRLKAYLQELSE